MCQSLRHVADTPFYIRRGELLSRLARVKMSVTPGKGQTLSGKDISYMSIHFSNQLRIIGQLTCYKILSSDYLTNPQKGVWHIGSAPDCLISHACIAGSNPADPTWVIP